MEHGNAPAAGQQSDLSQSQLETLCAALGWQGGTYWQVVDEIRRLKTCASLPAAAACAEQGEAVAVVGSDYTLLWAGSGPIAPIVERHGLRVGSKLYASLPPPARNGEMSILGFSRDDLECIAEGLEKGYEPTVNVGNTTGEGDEHLPSTTAVAARFIRAALSASCAPKQTEGDGK